MSATPKQLHTPTPWRTDQAGPWQVLHGGMVVAECWDLRRLGDAHPTPDANAAFIVRACNAHNALVEALEIAHRAATVQFDGNLEAMKTEHARIVGVLESALALAKWA